LFSEKPIRIKNIIDEKPVKKMDSPNKELNIKPAEKITDDQMEKYKLK